MDSVSDNCIYRKELKPERFSVREFESTVVKLAKAIKPHLPEKKLTICNCELFLSYLSSTCFMSREAAMAFLGTFMPLALDGLGLARLSMGIIETLPLYVKQSKDFKPFPSYDGTPSVTAHCKILHAFLYQADKGKIRCALLMLVMTSHKAGQLVRHDVSCEAAYNMMRDVKIFTRKNKVNHPPAPSELTGTYCTVLFGNAFNRIDVPLAYAVTSEEAKLNKALMYKRVNKDCRRSPSKTCSECLYGVEVCQIACRYRTKKERSENDDVGTLE